MDGIDKLLPVYVALVAAPAEPVLPSTLGMLKGNFEHLEIATYTIVLVIATQFQT
jgi:ferritin-like metal-binding protein YciE